MSPKTLKAISGEFADADREALFQAERLPETVRHARLLMAVAAALNGLSLVSDLRFLGEAFFPVAVAARVAIITASVGTFLVLRRTAEFREAQAAMLAWEAVVALGTATLVTRRSEIGLFVVLMLPAVYYLVVPTTFRWTLVAGGGASALLLAAYMLPAPNPGTSFGLAVAVLMANAAFALVVVRSNRLRRLEWRAARAERRAGEALARSRLLYEALFRAVPVPLVVTHLQEGRIVASNDAAEAFFGSSAAEAGVTRINDVYADPADRERLREGLAREGRVAGFETVARLADGTCRDIIVNARLVHLDGGLHVISGATDITARRQAEAALAAGEARTRALADALPSLVWAMRPEDGAATYVNRRFTEYYGPIGPARVERTGRNHPDDAGRMEAAWLAASARGHTFEIEGRLRRHDGAHRWHKLVMIPIRRDGQIAEWLGTAIDIDDIVTAQDKLRETTDLLRLAMEAAGAGTWEWDLVTGLARLCAESALMHGLPGRPVVLTGAEWGALVHPDDAARSLAVLRTAMEGGRTYSAEFRVPVEGGGVRWVHGMGRMVHDAEGRPLRLVGLNLDVTERKRAEAALGDARAAAEAARLEAERASEAKTEFLASMSHEIRTPLNAILGYTELLLDQGGLGEAERRHAERIEAAGAALLTVVDDILDFSKIEAGQVELEPVAFDPRAFLEDVVSITRGLAERKGLALLVAADRALPDAVIGDRDRLRQVLLNLVNDAIKFTPQGSVTLSLACAGEPAPEASTLCFSVTDTGIGIPAEKMHRLFDRFSQVDGSIRREFGGTGLGLAICKQLVALMGGTIEVRSEPGRGATFRFTVTLPWARTLQDPRRAAPRDAGARPARILLAEDVAINQELVRAVLAGTPHRLDVVADGADAVAAVQACAYDLVLMDVQMPGTDGVTAARLIRALPGPAREVPIVAMTANVLPFQVEQFRAAGMDDHVGKPFRRAELMAAIDRWAGGRRRAEPAPDPLDAPIHGELLALLGREGLDRMLDQLGALIEQTGLAGDDRSRLGQEAHRLVSPAGLIGFTGFSETCRALEAACLAESDLAAPLARALAEREAVLARIAALRAEAA